MDNPAQAADTGPVEVPEAEIPVASLDQGWEWALVLTSQGISCSLVGHGTPALRLRVEPSQEPEAARQIREYCLENPSPAGGDPSPVPVPRPVFDVRVLAWTLLVGAMFIAACRPGSTLGEWAEMEPVAFRAGQWWRPWSAVLLHVDATHLVWNLAIGTLVLGIAMARWGFWRTLLVTWAGGAVGNLAGLFLYHAPYHALGASGMVMAGLGLLFQHPAPAAEPRPPRGRPFLALVLLFVLLATDPRSDWVGHAAGFVVGLMLSMWLDHHSGQRLRRAARRAAVILLLAKCGVSMGALAGETELCRATRGLVLMEGGAHARPTLADAGDVVLEFPRVTTPDTWNQAIASWNMDLPPRSRARVEIRAWVQDRPTRFYILGWWSATPSPGARTSVPGQSDADGQVNTDLLVLRQPARELQPRVIVSGVDPGDLIRLKLLAFSLSSDPPGLDAPTGEDPVFVPTLDVPQRSQMAYPEGRTWCSPTAVAMILDYWAAKTRRSELSQPVPEVARQVNDPGWPGTGNWSFNAAFAGSLPGLKAIALRLPGMPPLTRCLNAGIPVAASVSYSRLQGRIDDGGGHLVVVVGLDGAGGVVVNDPGTSTNIRRTFRRDDFEAAWRHSGNLVYLVWPEDQALPPRLTDWVVR